MKLVYLVYREDNVMVYESQVLEYLRAMKEKYLFDSIELIVFRHEQNLTKKDEVEERIHRYIDKAMTFWSFPVISILQLNVNAARLKKYLITSYSKNEQVSVICRGDLAAYIGIRAFKDYPNSRILYDNRGLSYEESVMSHARNLIHKINRNVKRKALLRSKDHCDMYNFVTNAMREYMIQKYNFSPSRPYTIIPTLYHAESVSEKEFRTISNKERIGPNDYVISYIGSTAAWQSTKQLIEIIRKIGEKYLSAHFFILSNGQIQELQSLPEHIRNRVILKSVPHKEMKYYLKMTQIGIVIRDNNIVNHVAAPTKIAEYLTSGVTILYSGDIGIINDLRSKTDGSQLICIDNEPEWLKKIDPNSIPPKRVDPIIVDYFDMDKRQYETFNMMRHAFEKPKVE
jgi:hypothetical protein